MPRRLVSGEQRDHYALDTAAFTHQSKFTLVQPVARGRYELTTISRNESGVTLLAVQEAALSVAYISDLPFGNCFALTCTRFPQQRRRFPQTDIEAA